MSKKNPVSREELEELTVADLEKLATKRGVTVTRGDGAEGDPLKSDYVDALEKADAGASAGATSSAKARGQKGKAGERVLDETVPGGRYINASGDTVDANGKVIEKADSDEDEE